MGTSHDAGMLDTILGRLEALERENRALREKVAALEGGGTTDPRAVPAAAGRVLSRRAMLRRAAGAAVATVTAGAMLERGTGTASAHHYDAGIRVNYVTSHYLIARNADRETAVLGATSSSEGAVRGVNLEAGPGVYGENNGTGPAVEGVGKALGGIGVKGTGRIGVQGEASGASLYGVFGRNAGGTGVRGEGPVGVQGVGNNGVHGRSSATGYGAVWGQHTGQGYGVVGDGAGSPNAGVLGRNATGDGVRGEGQNGVVGTGTTGVHGRSTGGSNGVYGVTTSDSTDYGAVAGLNYGTGPAVLGEGNGEGVRGEGAIGVHGIGSGAGGYGGQFEGDKAQLRLVPAGRRGKPTTGSHQKGELYMDSAATLYVCTASGTPGTWRRVAMA